MRILTPLVLTLILFPLFYSNAQVGIGTSAPNTNAVLELKSPDNNQGFLVPRLTTAERTAMNGLSDSEKGLLVFDTDTNKFYYWSGSAWIVIEDSTGTDSQTLSFTSPNLNISGGNSINLSALINTDGQTLTYTPGTGLLAISGGNNVTISGTVPGGSASGDLSGTYPGPTIATGAGNNIVTAVNNVSTTGTLNTNRLNASVVLDTESPAAGDVTGSYSGGMQINPNVVTTAEILDGTVASSDITDATIATVDLANSSVTDAKIGAGITVSKLAASATAGHVLTTVGTTTTWATLPDASAINEIQDLSLSTNILSLSGDATTVNLAPYLDNTDNQDLTLTGNTLSLTNDGTSVSLAGYLDNTDSQTLTFTSPNLSINGGNSVNISAINTDAQTLSFTSPTLSISGGNSINLSTINTDNQDLTLTGNTLSLTNDATTINLAPYLDNTDNQDLSLAGNTLSLVGDATTVNLAPYLDNTDNQDLTLTGNTLSLTNDGSTVSLAGYLDNTDAQTLAFTSPNLSINGGNSINISAINTDAQTLTFTPATSTLAISGGNSVSVTATGAAGGDLTGTFPNPTIASGAVTSTKILDGTIASVDIADATIVAADLASSSVTDAKIASGITVSKLTASVTAGQVLTTVGTTTSWAALPDASATNEIQNLSSTAVGTQRTINISGGTGTTIDVADSDNSVSNEIQDLASVLTQGNDAKTLAAVNFSAISINALATPGALNVDGSHFRSFTVLPLGSEIYDVKPEDYIILGTSGTGKPYDVILPKAGASRGRILIIRATGSSAGTGIRVVSTELIDGTGSLPVMYTEGNNIYSVTVISDGKDWYTISKSRY